MCVLARSFSKRNMYVAEGGIKLNGWVSGIDSCNEVMRSYIRIYIRLWCECGDVIFCATRAANAVLEIWFRSRAALKRSWHCLSFVNIVMPCLVWCIVMTVMPSVMGSELSLTSVVTLRAGAEDGAIGVRNMIKALSRLKSPSSNQIAVARVYKPPGAHPDFLLNIWSFR